MRVLVASEAHFVHPSEGGVYASGPEDYGFWSAYLQVFDEVGILARVKHDAAFLRGSRADGPGVLFHALDDYRGPRQYLQAWFRLRRQARQAVRGYDAIILRAPGAVAYLAWHEAERLGKPYAVEVLGDPWESLAPGRTAGVWRGAARWWSRRSLKRLCRRAPVASYVTSSYLQQRYPTAGVSFACSDVRL